MMPKTSAANKKRLADLKAAARRGHMLQAKKTGKPLIPDAVIKKLAALHLPANEFVYEACLEKLMRGK